MRSEQRKPQRTLLASEVINLTKKEMWTYGTSGEFIQLKPWDLKTNVIIPDSNKYVYYVFEESEDIREFLKRYPMCINRIVLPTFIGKGKKGREIFHFITADGTEVMPITDGMGHPGSIVTEKEPYTVTPIFTTRWANA